MVFKKLLALTLLIGTAHANTLRTSQDQQFLNAQAPRNYILNSGAEKNDLNVTDASSIHTRTITDPLEGTGSHLIDATATSQLVVFVGAPLQRGLHGGNCEGKLTYSGDATLLTAYVTLNGVRVSDIGTLQNISSGSQPVSINFPCGVSDTDVASVAIASTGNAALVKFDSVQVGAATNVGSVAQAEVVGRATRITSTQSIMVAGATKIQFNSGSFAYGTFDGTTNYRFTPGKAGNYEVKLSLYLDGLTVNSYVQVDIYKNGVAQGHCTRFNRSSSTASDSTWLNICNVNITSPTDYLEMFVQSGDANYSVAASAISNYEITRFPTASEQVLRIGAPGQLPTSYTPTFAGLGTVTNVDVQYQCVAAQKIMVWGRINPGTTPAAPATISLPAGFTTATSSVGDRMAGSWNFSSASTGGVKNGAMWHISGGTTIAFRSNDYSTGINPFTATNGNALFSGNIVTFQTFIDVTADSPCAAASMPLVKHAVTTSFVGTEKQVSGELNCDASSTFNRGGTGLTAGNRSTTSCGITIAVGTFSAQPWDCQVTVKSATVNAMSCSCSSATACTVYGPNADYDAYLSIKGPN